MSSDHRIFYPTAAQPRWCLLDTQSRRWLPHINCTWGYFSKLVQPSSYLRDFLIWTVTCFIHLFIWLQLHCSVAKPMLGSETAVADDRELPGKSIGRRLPVVIFCHGMWACRTTYTIACCDTASHGYIVVAVEHLDGSAVEHLDGSAVAAKYRDASLMRSRNDRLMIPPWQIAPSNSRTRSEN